MKQLYRLTTGIYWKYNVFQGDVPVKEFGKVCYTVDDFGNAVIISTNKSLRFSIQ